MDKKSKPWWHTDCEFCKRMRLLFAWLIIMCVADYFWFHLLFDA